ncbi:MAG: hypothetical protein EB023_03590 [Flavobacteriia bacterium]|nr:hypothetical protein [Flavobacteriia bacterium]
MKPLKSLFLTLIAFASVLSANEYLNAFKAGIEELGDYQNNKCLIITQENLKKLIESDNFEAYKTFHDLNY